MPLIEVGTYIDEDGKRLVDIARWKGDDSGPIREIQMIAWRKEKPETDPSPHADDLPELR